MSNDGRTSLRNHQIRQKSGHHPVFLEEENKCGVGFPVLHTLGPELTDQTSLV